MRILLLIVLIVASLFLGNFLPVVDAHLRHFDRHRLHMVDKVGPNLLFRGNSPLSKDYSKFDYDSIISEMQKVSCKRGIIFPETFVMLDVSLLDPDVYDDQFCLNIEREYFKQNPNHGMLLNWIVLGETINPDNMSNKTEMRNMAKDLNQWSHDKVPYLVQMLGEYMNMHNYTPLVIYLHCMAGVDRTGEIAGAYALRYRHANLKSVIKQDTEYNNGHLAPGPHAMNGLLWYNEYLKVTY